MSWTKTSSEKMTKKTHKVTGMPLAKGNHFTFKGVTSLEGVIILQGIRL